MTTLDWFIMKRTFFTIPSKLNFVQLKLTTIQRDNLYYEPMWGHMDKRNKQELKSEEMTWWYQHIYT